MPWNSRLAATFAFAMSIGLAAPDPAVAEDRDSREVSAYVLTESGLSKFAQASKNLASVPGACAAEEDDDSDDLQVDRPDGRETEFRAGRAGGDPVRRHDLARIRRLHVLDDAERHGGVGA